MTQTLEALAQRDGLPDALRVLIADFPREIWETHPNFGEMVQFWLSRHVMFRELLTRLEEELQGVLWDGADPDRYRARLGRMGGFFLQQLHAHHQIEDHHYFPRLVGLDSRIDHGFALLETDHAAIDGILAGFTETANRVLQGADGMRDALGALDAVLQHTHRDLFRHLEDEEDLIVPVILKSGFQG